MKGTSKQLELHWNLSKYLIVVCVGWISSLQYSRHESQYIQQLQNHIEFVTMKFWWGVVGVMIFLSLDTISV